MSTSKPNDKKLCLGKRRDGTLFHLLYDSKQMYRHAAIIGQSGSGKSSMLGRLVEEMLLHLRAKIIILDLNADFTRFRQINTDLWKELFEKSKNLLSKEEYLLDSKDFFCDRWDKISENFRNYGFLTNETKLFISFANLSERGLQEVLGFDPLKQPECVWMMSKIFLEAKKGHWALSKWKQLSQDIVKWARKYVGEKDYELFGSLPEFISVTLPVSAAQSIANALNDALQYKIWNEQTGLAQFEEMLQEVESIPLLTCINVAFVKDKIERLVIVRYLLEGLWKKSKEERSKLITGEHKVDERFPIFLVVDEAHNVAPQEPNDMAEAGVLELFRRTAAEGRKEGIFLILSTQRPQKIHSDIISECDNVCIMKIVSQSDIGVVQKCFSLNDPKLLEAVSNFKTGEAIFNGPWVNNSPVQVQLAPHRTKEGGADLPKGNICRK